MTDISVNIILISFRDENTTIALDEFDYSNNLTKKHIVNVLADITGRLDFIGVSVSNVLFNT